MKKILVTGANSYIGTSFEAYIRAHYPGQYAVDTVDLLDGAWRGRSFAGYDAVFHVAGIAHSDRGWISEEQKRLYYAVNTDLTVETAVKAKADGAGQFVFMSSAIVYGACSALGKRKMIGADTPVHPANCYGDSKVKAEEGLRALRGDGFRVAILRPPMIYGKGCRGNYPILSKLACKLPFCPYVDNERSMVYIENFLEFVRLVIENDEDGVFFPQNAEYVNTSEMIGVIARTHGRRIKLTKAFAWCLYVLRLFTPLVDKAFGSLTYDKAISEYGQPYRKYGLDESVERTEG